MLRQRLAYALERLFHRETYYSPVFERPGNLPHSDQTFDPYLLEQPGIQHVWLKAQPAGGNRFRLSEVWTAEGTCCDRGRAIPLTSAKCGNDFSLPEIAARMAEETRTLLANGFHLAAEQPFRGRALPSLTTAPRLDLQ